MENIELWHAAQQLISEYGDAAAMQAAMRLEQAVKEGNLRGPREMERSFECGLYFNPKQCGVGNPFHET